MKRRRRVLVLRAAGQASALAEQLEARGLEAVLLPAIETVPPRSFAVLDEALRRLGSFDWMLFTSANAVEAVQERLEIVEASLPTALRVAAIGPGTARVVEAQGWRVDLLPAQAVNESLAEALLPFARMGERAGRFLLPRAEEAREVLPEVLRDAGGEVLVAPAYRTVVPERSVARLRALRAGAEPEVDAVAFTSASTVRNLQTLCAAAGVTLPEQVMRVSIGPITSAALREAGWRVDAEAAAAGVEALGQAVAGVLAGLPDGPEQKTNLPFGE